MSAASAALPFGMPVHMKNAQVAGVATTAAEGWEEVAARLGGVH